MKVAGWVLVVGAVACGPRAPAAPAAAPSAVTEADGDAAYAAKDYKRCAELYLAAKGEDAQYNAAFCLALDGQVDAAFAMLDKAVAGGYRDLRHLLADRDLASLRSDPRWAGLVKAVERNIAKYEATLKEPALRREILALRDEDQVVREAMIKNMDDKAAIAAVQASDKKSTARMKEIVAKYGWPGKSLIGSDGARAAWLLVQHADKDVEFQKQCLVLIEAAVKTGEMRGIEYAYLFDRLAVAERRPQRYGTQFANNKPQPIEDEAHVDERRKKLGLPTMGEYAKAMEGAYGEKFAPTTK